jgi:hypothetical protein
MLGRGGVPLRDRHDPSSFVIYPQFRASTTKISFFSGCFPSLALSLNGSGSGRLPGVFALSGSVGDGHSAEHRRRRDANGGRGGGQDHFFFAFKHIVV